MLDLVWLIPALPLAGFLVLLVGGRRLGEPWAGWLAAACCGGSFLATVLVFFGLVDREAEARQFQQILFEWLPVGGLHVDVAFLVDPLSITMALFVTGVGTLIHVYSVGYMHGDRDFSKFFIYLNLFVFSMLMLVLGNNLLLTFLGWEGVGACSYLLISFWFTKDANASAGKKAFVTNRVGDFGFMVATFLVFTQIGSLDYLHIAEGARGLTETTATAIALLFLVAAAGKSAQIPLFVWLPDAMAGPTPVSALIHAATMVTSGVYLLARINPVLAEAPDAATVIAIVGAATALFAATAACAQYDIKRILAYSTISQLGYMVLAVGSGVYVAAIFHMVTHAFFKALLFLGAGSVIHGMHDEQDVRHMGGLRRYMPITAATFIIGWLAIAGVPPFAGFWSKDEVLLAAWNKSEILWGIGLLTALLTAYYMSRQVFLVFFGDKRYDDEHAKPHESKLLMWLPLVALAGLSIVGGGLNLPFTKDTKFLEHWLEPVFGENEVHIDASSGEKWVLAIVAVVAGLAGIAFAYRAWIQRRVRTEALEPALLQNAWYVDRGISDFMDKPGRKAFELVTWFDKTIIDGAVNGVGSIVRAGGAQLRRAQTGYVRSYALGVIVGAVGLLAWFLYRGMA